MKRFLYILVATGLALVGCNHAEMELVESPGEFESTSDTTLRVQVQFQVSLPELTPLSKALGETPAQDLTSMHIAIFGRSGYLKEYVEAQIQAPTANGKIGESTNRYTITATLALSENSERHIHFLGNGPESMEFGQETDLIPNLMSPVGKGGYWQYIVVPGIKAKRNRDLYDDAYLAAHPDVDPDKFILENGNYVLHDSTAAYFSDIALIRNFSKIVVEDIEGCHFQTHSFAAVNVATSGSFAPYYSGGFINNYQKKSYLALRDTLAYPALLPIHASFTDFCPDSTAFKTLGTGVAAKGGSVYMYERPVPDDDQKPTSVIIYGHFSDNDLEDGDDSGDYYYKVDLMDGKGYYPIYRNFKYRIQIKEILRPGAKSPEDALHTMGSGDISADIATQNLTDLSDGTSHIEVSYMNKTLIHKYPHETEQLTLLYKYIPDIDKDENGDGKADWNNDLVASGGPISITPQTTTDIPIITDYTVAESDDVNGFRTITITTSAPTGYLRTQYLQIKGTHTVTTENSTTSNSLYRNVTFSMISTQTMTVTCSPSRVTQEVGQPVTLNITIPKNLPSSMFPLVFNLEAEQLSLTPDNSKQNNNLPVKSGDSIYKTGKTAFHFIRTVSEDEYRSLSSESLTTTVTISCYFKTNKAESATIIHVIDEEGYFLPGKTSFKNAGLKDFTELEFSRSPIGVPQTYGSTAPFTFLMDRDDILPEKVYLKFEGVRPTPSSGLTLVTNSSDPNSGWYWYSPTQTQNQNLNTDRYKPIIDLATTSASGIASVTIKADEYNQESLEYTNPGITQEGWTPNSICYVGALQKISGNILYSAPTINGIVQSPNPYSPASRPINSNDAGVSFETSDSNVAYMAKVGNDWYIVPRHSGNATITMHVRGTDDNNDGVYGGPNDMYSAIDFTKNITVSAAWWKANQDIESGGIYAISDGTDAYMMTTTHSYRDQGALGSLAPTRYHHMTSSSISSNNYNVDDNSGNYFTDDSDYGYTFTTNNGRYSLQNGSNYLFPRANESRFITWRETDDYQGLIISSSSPRNTTTNPCWVITRNDANFFIRAYVSNEAIDQYINYNTSYSYFDCGGSSSNYVHLWRKCDDLLEVVQATGFTYPDAP